MSTNDIKDYMGLQFPHIFVTWINDSSCTLKFVSSDQATEAYKKFSMGQATFANK
jgi:hypothetical protein